MKSVQYLSKLSSVLLHGAALCPSRRVPPALGTTVRLQRQPYRWCSAAGEARVELVAAALHVFAAAGEENGTKAVIAAWRIAGPARVGVGELLGQSVPEGNYPRLASVLARAIWPPPLPR